MLDFRALCSEPYAISAEDLDTAERESGTKVQDGDIVIIHTGWAARWGYGPHSDRQRYGGTEHARNPGLGTDTPPWFIERHVKIVGSDGFNLDADSHFTNHWNFLFRDMIGEEPIQVIENLVNLEQIPEPRFFFIGLPMPIKDGSGSPIRALAFV
jgi:kynurenine formamidase